MNEIPLLLAISAFIITFALTMLLARKLQKMGFQGRDLHKEDGRMIPEQGGIAIFVGFLVPIGTYGILSNDPNIILIASIVLIVGILGIYDRIHRLSAIQKVISLSLIGVLTIPMADTRIMGIELGILYLIALPILFMATCNFTNMLAGLNGLEIGTGAIASLGIAILSYINGQLLSLIISLSMFASLMAFLHYNKFPARVFPGDVGTLIIGAALFPAIIIGKFEIAGAIILFPYVIDALLKYRSAGIMTRESQIPTKIKDGILFVSKGSNMSLARIFITRGNLTEPQVVVRVFGVMAVFSSLGILTEVFLI